MVDKQYSPSVDFNSQMPPVPFVDACVSQAPRKATETGRLEELIARATDGRIQNLRVNTVNEHLVVRGIAPTYYAWQLALSAVKNAVESSSATGPTVEFDVEVARNTRNG